MSLDPYQDYLDASRVKLGRLRKQAKRRAAHHVLLKSKYGKGWSRHAKGSAEHLKDRLARSTDPLSIKTRREILLQARGNVNQAYAPDEAALSAREKRARSIGAKRDADEKMFAAWQDSQQAKLDAQSRAAQDALLARQREIQGAQEADHAQAPQDVAQTVASQPGSVTSAAALQGSAAVQGVRDKDQQSRDLLRIQQTRTNAQIASGSQRRTIAQAAVHLGQQAARVNAAKQLFTELQGIADDRQQVTLKKAAAASGEVARLLDSQVKIAQGKQELALAGAKLGVDAADKKAKNRLAGKRLKLDYKEYLRKLGKDQLDAKAKQIDQQLTRRDLDRKDRELLEKKRSNIAKEQNARLKASGKGGVTLDKKARQKYTRYYSTFLSGGGINKKNSGYDDLLARAAAQRYRKGGVDPQLAKLIYKTYGFHVRVRKSQRTSAGKLGDRLPGT